MRKTSKTAVESVDRGAYAMAYQIADAFFAVAEPYLLKLEESVPTGGPATILDATLLPVAAVNLGFALELYLKSLRLLVGLPDHDTHQLWPLYKTLPVETKAEIERLYEALVGQRQPGSLYVLDIIVEAAPLDAADVLPQFSKRTEPLKTDVANVLRRSTNLFTAWRYTHESVKGNARFSDEHSFEYVALRLFRLALAQCIISKAHPTPPG